MSFGKSRPNLQFTLQLGLIVLPLLVLSGVGFYLLRQDKHLVEQEAREKAGQLASELAATAWNSITNLSTETLGTLAQDGVRKSFMDNLPPEVLVASNKFQIGHAFRLSGEGKLVVPKPMFEAAEATSEQAKKAIGLWQKSLSHLQEGNAAEAVNVLNEVAHICIQERNTISLPGGFSLGHAALLKGLEVQLQQGLSSLETEKTAGLLGAALTEFPAASSSFVFTRARELLPNNDAALRELSSWQEKYEREEAARRIYASASPLISALRNETNAAPFAPLLFAHQGTLWWGILRPNVGADTVDCYAYPRTALALMLENAISLLKKPAYLSFQFGSGLSNLPGSTNHHLLASIESPLPVQAYLANPQLLFQYQRQRAGWFSALIAISCLAAIAGVANALISLRKQQRLNELKSNFVSSVSHELRAPLASMRLLSEGLQSGRVDSEEKQREYFSYLVQECRRLSVLVENVLDFSRIEQNRKTYNFEEVDLSALLSLSIHILQPAATEQQVALELDLPAQEIPLTARADAHALQQAVLNLVDNALKHSSPGQAVKLAARNGDQGIRISVADRGPGIARQEHEKIFERFYRLGSELRRETPGVGIGLSIVKHVVEAHQGRIELESEPGQGSIFTIVLPNS